MANINGVTWKWLVGVLISIVGVLILALVGLGYKNLKADILENKLEIRAINVTLDDLRISLERTQLLDSIQTVHILEKLEEIK